MPRSWQRRYGVALLVCALVLLVKLLLNDLIGRDTPSLLFVFAVLLSALYGGQGPGLLATALTSLAVAYFFLTPTRSFNINGAGALRLAIFLVEGVVVTWLSASRRRVEADLRASNQRVSTILSSVTDAFLALDGQWRFTFVNPRAEQLLLRSRDQLLGKNIWAEFPESVGSIFYERYHEAMSGSTTVEFEEFYPPMDAWFSVHAYPSEEGLSIFFSDIDERKRVEERQQFLSEASTVLAGSLDYETTLGRVAGLVVPGQADWCSIEMLEDDGTLKQLAVAHVDPEKVRWAKELRERYPVDLNEETGLANVLRSGRAELYPDITDEMMVAAAVDAEQLAVIRAVGFRSGPGARHPGQRATPYLRPLLSRQQRDRADPGHGHRAGGGAADRRAARWQRWSRKQPRRRHDCHRAAAGRAASGRIAIRKPPGSPVRTYGRETQMSGSQTSMNDGTAR